MSRRTPKTFPIPARHISAIEMPYLKVLKTRCGLAKCQHIDSYLSACQKGTLQRWLWNTPTRNQIQPTYCNCGTGAGSRRAGSIRSRLLWRTGLQILSFCILQISVVRFRPSLAAAPFGPPTTQAVDSSVCRITARSESLRVVAAGETATG